MINDVIFDAEGAYQQPRFLNAVSHHLEKIGVRTWPDMPYPTCIYGNEEIAVAARSIMIDVTADPKDLAEQIAAMGFANFAFYRLQKHNIDSENKFYFRFGIWDFPKEVK